MHPIPPTTIDIDGLSVLPVRPLTMLSNVMNVYCLANRRGSYRVSREKMMPEFVKQLDLSLRPAVSWTSKSGTDDSIIFEQTKDKWQKLTSILGEFTALLEALPEKVDDIGRTNFRELDLVGGWSSEFVVSPSLGYPREYKAFAVQTGIENADGLMLPNVCGEFSRRLATTLFLMDLARLSTDLIPKPQQVDGHDVRAQPWGPFLSAEENLKTVRMMFILYAIQGQLLVAHCNRRLNEKRFELGYTLDRRLQPMMDAWRANWEYVLNEGEFPMHPLTGYVAHSLLTGTIQTIYGDRDILYRWGARENSEKLAKATDQLMQKIPENGDRPEMRKQIIAAAVHDSGIALQHRENGNGGSWGDCYTKNMEPRAQKEGKEFSEYNIGAFDDTPITYGTFARQMKSLSRMVQYLSTYASQLGWTSLRGDIGEVHQKDADFIVCDGEVYSASATAAVLGLRPVISAGNGKISGFEEVQIKDWNRGDGFVIKPGQDGLFKYSTVVVDGYQGQTTEPEMLARFYHPAGMTMGGNYHKDFYFAAGVTEDPIGLLAVEYYKQMRSSGGRYVTQWYTDPLPGKKQPFHYTSWDGWAWGKDGKTVGDAYLAAYEKDVKDIAESGFYVADGRFYWRIPVQMSRPQYVEMYNEDGVMNYIFGFRGAVSLGGDTPVGVSSADLEAIVNINPRDIAERTMTLTKPTTTDDQVAAPSKD
jgi:hypothetical protein